MRAINVALFFVCISTATIAYAQDALPDTALKNIIIVEIKDGKAVVQGAGGIQAEVSVGDKMGSEGGTVVEIQESFITVEIGATRTRMPARPWFIR